MGSACRKNYVQEEFVELPKSANIRESTESMSNAIKEECVLKYDQKIHLCVKPAMKEALELTAKKFRCSSAQLIRTFIAEGLKHL